MGAPPQGDLLWGEFALKPRDLARSLREVFAYPPRSRPAIPELAVVLVDHALQLRDPGFGFGLGPKAD